MSHFHPDVMAATLPDFPQRYGDGGGSLWIQRSARSPTSVQPDDVGGGRALADLQLMLADAQARYEHLRQRKAVRLALELSALRHRRPWSLRHRGARRADS